ncbi:MAG: DUF1554 domain-containing protein [Bacteroidia bacterium]|nr:DUF1554 domain-containing protein [Bacteroidia bacterium]
MPTATDAVIIPAGKTVLINNTNATCANITVQAGGQVDRNGTGTLTVTNNPVAGACTASCAKRVFVTSTQHTGNLGGLAGADNICQTRANAAGLGGTWKAWLSDGSTSAASRLVQHTTNMVRIDNVVVANGWADLTDGSIDNPINITELGGTITATPDFNNTLVFTNTNTSGGIFGSNHCSNWTSTSNSFAPHYGQCTVTNSDWTNWGTIVAQCGLQRRLYCFEQ